MKDIFNFHIIPLLFKSIIIYIMWYVLCTDGILSYSMPQGDKRSPEWEFYDSTYDGYWDVELQKGLGQLTDGKVGLDNFRMGYYDTEKGKYIKYFTIVFFL